MNTPLLQSPYLREQRQFPPENLQELARQTDQSYIDIANKVNARTIGIYATNFPVITGEQWYLAGQPKKQQTLRQIYQISSYSNFAHGIDVVNSVSIFTKIYGIALSTNGNYFTIPFINASITDGNVGIFVGPTNVNFTTNTNSPSIASGIIILEWLSQF